MSRIELCNGCDLIKPLVETSFSEKLFDPEYICFECNTRWKQFVDSFLPERNEMWIRCNIFTNPFSFIHQRDASIQEKEHS